MTIPDEAVQAMPERIFLGCADTDNEHQVWTDEGEGGTEYVRADLAAPFLQGVKVKALEWVSTGQTGFLETEFYAVAGSLMHTVHPLKDVDGAFNEHYSIHRDWNDREVWRVTYYVGNNGLSGISKVCKSLEAAKSAAQTDYEARILSAIEPAPSPRAQALEEEEFAIDKLRFRAFHTNSEADRKAYFDAVSKWFQDRHYRRMDAERALSSQPVADRHKTVDELAAYLCDEFDFDLNPVQGASWPEHENDEGKRDGGYVRLQPSDVQAYARENAKRILTFLSLPASPEVSG